jgi:hypothetical protein
MRELSFAPRDGIALVVAAVASVGFALPYEVWVRLVH